MPTMPKKHAVRSYSRHGSGRDRFYREGEPVAENENVRPPDVPLDHHRDVGDQLEVRGTIWRLAFIEPCISQSGRPSQTLYWTDGSEWRLSPPMGSLSGPHVVDHASPPRRGRPPALRRALPG